MKKTLIIIIILALVIALYRLNASRDLPPQSGINKVSFIVEKSTLATSPDPKKDLQQNDPIPSQVLINKKIAVGEAFISESSYLDLFYDYQLALTCRQASYVYDHDFLIPQKKLNNPRELFLKVNAGFNTTDFQLTKWQQFVEDCQKLVKNYDYLLLVNHASAIDIHKTPSVYQEDLVTGDRSYEGYYDSDTWNSDTTLTYELLKKLKTHPAKTQIEKSLKETITLASQYNQFRKNTALSANPKYLIPLTEANQIKDEIRMALSDLNYQFTTDIDGETRLADDFNENRIHELRAYLAANTQIDEQKFIQNKTNYINLHNNLMAKLPTASGHEFKIIIETITQGLRPFDAFEEVNASSKKHHIEVPEVNQLIYQNTHIKDPKYYTFLIGPMLNILYCYKGTDCSSDSLISTKYCLGLTAKVALSAACEQNLENFYFQSFLTENQSIDALSLLNYLVENYAQ